MAANPAKLIGLFSLVASVFLAIVGFAALDRGKHRPLSRSAGALG